MHDFLGHPVLSWSILSILVAGPDCIYSESESGFNLLKFRVRIQQCSPSWGIGIWKMSSGSDFINYESGSEFSQSSPGAGPSGFNQQPKLERH